MLVCLSYAVAFLLEQYAGSACLIYEQIIQPSLSAKISIFLSLV